MIGQSKWRLYFLSILAGLVVGPSWCLAEPATVGGSGTPSLSPLQGVENIRRHAQELRNQRLAGMAPKVQGPTGAMPIKKREGVFYFVSWSIPDELLKGYMREAYRLGATVVFRGMIDNDMRKTVDQTKALAVELQQEAPHTTIDPIIFRQLGVTSVPTLAIVNDQAALMVTGAAPLEALLSQLSRSEGTIRPLREWYVGQTRSWQMGGPVTEPRPVMPVLTGISAVPTDLTRYAIAEQDMEEYLKEQMRRVDWGRVREDLQRRVVERLHEGPNIGLQPATSSRVFTVDVTQRYEHDILNHDGTAVVVKGGTEINPLTRIALSHRYVVIDGRDAKQLTYAQSLIQRYGFGVKILLSAGDVSEVAKQLQRRVYWVQPEMVSKFQLAHVPSVISQNGPVLKIEEVAL